MNANINYDEIPDTSAVQEDLLAALSSQHVTVHTNEEPDFDYMENEDVAFVVKNPHNDEDLLIELGGEFSLFFGLWHGQYKPRRTGLRPHETGHRRPAGGQGRCAEPVRRRPLAGQRPLPGKGGSGCGRCKAAGALLAETGAERKIAGPGRPGRAALLGPGGQQKLCHPGKGVTILNGRRIVLGIFNPLFHAKVL